MMLTLVCHFLQENEPRNLLCKVIFCSFTELIAPKHLHRKEFFKMIFGCGGILHKPLFRWVLRDGTNFSKAHRFAWKSPTPPANLRTVNLSNSALFSLPDKQAAYCIENGWGTVMQMTSLVGVSLILGPRGRKKVLQAIQMGGGVLEYFFSKVVVVGGF